MEVAALGLKVDGVSNIDQASGALGKFRSSADRAQDAADGLGSSSAKAKKPIDEIGKAGDKSANQLESLSASATKAGAAIGIAAAATVAAITAMTIATVNQANEITKLSLFSGTTTDEFQKLAAAANLVGIEQEKLGDIFKDTQDKIGDFLQSGAGELNDFFEKIAPKVGVTADSFRGLSGPDALGLYVSSLEKAGASQAEMVFYLEAIASDSTALLPLLKDNAAGFRELGDMAEQAGAIMDRETIRAAKEMAAVMWQADIAIGGMKDQMMKGLLPALSGVATAMMGVSTNTAIAEDAGRTLGTMVKGLAAVATGAYAAFDLLGKGIAGAFAIADAADVSTTDFLLGGPVKIAAKLFKGRDKVQQTAEIVKEDLAKTVEDFGKVLDGIWSAGEGGDTDSATKRIADLLEQQSALYKGLGTSISSATSEQEKAAKEAAKAEQAIASQLSALERAREIWGMSEDAVVLYDLAQQGATKTQLAYAGSLLETVTALEKQKEAEEAAAREREKFGNSAFSASAYIRGDVDPLSGGAFDQQAARYEAEAVAEQERFFAQIERLREAEDLKIELIGGYQAEEERLLLEHNARMAQIEQAKNSVMLQSNAEMFAGMAGLAEMFAGEQSGIYKALFATSKAFAIYDATVNAYGAISKAWNSAPFPANLAAVAATTPAVMGVVSSISGINPKGFAQGGYTGNMGRSDVAGVVHGQEFVMNAAATARIGVPTLEALQAGRAPASSVNQSGGDSVVVNLHNAPAGMTATARTMREDKRLIIDVMLEDAAKGGEFTSTFANTFGLQRAGR